MMVHAESCSCGASIRSFSMRAVREWRQSHHHEVAAQEEPSHPMYFESSGSAIERGYFEAPPGRPTYEVSAAGVGRHVPLGFRIPSATDATVRLG